jgi:hypothetical protein
MIIWCGDIDIQKLIWTNIDEFFLKCTSNYYFWKINSLDVHLSNIKWQWVKLEIFNSLWQTSHDVLPHG